VTLSQLPTRRSLRATRPRSLVRRLTDLVLAFGVLVVLPVMVVREWTGRAALVLALVVLLSGLALRVGAGPGTLGRVVRDLPGFVLRSLR
jgi:hypothetical protein